MKPRNHVTLAMHTRHSGAHGKSHKAKRRNEKIQFKKNLEY
jgi:hypothetical protein